MLAAAMRAGALEDVRIWALELRWSLFHLADLHRWLSLLYGNMLAALDFQAKCRQHFVAADRLYEMKEAYDPAASLSRFAAGSLLLYGERNLYEVERQAEALFGLAGREHIAARNDVLVPAAFAMPTNLRAEFLALYSALPPRGREALEAAATSVYSRSGLENQLFRLSRANVMSQALEVLQRLFDRRPDAGASGLLDSLFYRGGGFFCGLEWADRFDPRLFDVAAGIGREPRRMLQMAQALTHRRYDPKAYIGGTLTLRSALDTRAFDCIRATDMIGAIYRNAGGTGFVELRECRGGHSHTVAGLMGDDGRVFTVDGLEPGSRGNKIWPNSYFRSPREFAVEVHARGLDTSIWMSGYIVRGEFAGLRVDADLPHLPSAAPPGQKTVFGGPYPKGRSNK